MKASDAFPGKYLKFQDLDDSDVTVTIERVEMAEFEQDGEKQHKPAVFFQDFEKGLLCNKTNWDIITSLHGEETDDWEGKKITLYPNHEVSFKGKTVSAIRVRSKPQKLSGPKAKGKSADPAVKENGALDLKGKIQKATAELMTLAGSSADKVLMEFSYCEVPDKKTGEIKKFCTSSLEKVLAKNAEGEQAWAVETLIRMQEAIYNLKGEMEPEGAPY